jgi:hypothetical protein
LKVMRVSSSAKNTPELESSAEAIIATGAAKLPNSNSSTVNTRITAMASTITRS